jgi:hypothetical protein
MDNLNMNNLAHVDDITDIINFFKKFIDDSGSILTNDMEMNRSRIMRVSNNLIPAIDLKINLEKFKELIDIINPEEQIFKFPKHLNGHTNSSFEKLIRLYKISLQQFCFWVSPSRQDIRTITSSSIFDAIMNHGVDQENSQINIEKEFNNSVNLRKNRLSIFKESCNIANSHLSRLNYLSKYLNYNYSELDGFKYLFRSLYFSNQFKDDFYAKKQSLFLMFLIRFKDDFPKEISEYIDGFKFYCNPAIDYQIPKMLNYYGVIEYPSKLKDIISQGTIIQKDSTDELYIRSVSYWAMVKMQEKFGLNQEELDGILWYMRSSVDAKHHCVLTEDY